MDPDRDLIKCFIQQLNIGSEGGLWSIEKRSTASNLTKVSEKIRDGLSAWTVSKEQIIEPKGLQPRGFRQSRS
jgi:hypothetical protein